MRNFVGKVLAVFGGLLVSGIAFAEGDAASAVGGASGLVAIASGIAMGLSALGGTMAQGKAAGAALEGIARNPGSKDAVFTPMILALALIEFQAIMGFIIAILWWIK
jgi:F-type H+-transporting ATPase subunit c